MKKICIQAGHQGRTSGSTGAPGEQKWTSEIVPKIASILRTRGFEVKEVNADPSSSEIAGDWDLFLSVHYDADIYDDRGGFIAIPHKSVDYSHNESSRIAQVMRNNYFKDTGIPEKDRSNKNTQYYYMWSRLSAKTPCVLIEAGVGWRTPQDHHTLWFEQDKVAKAIADGITNALGGQTTDDGETVGVGKNEFENLVKNSTFADNVIKELDLNSADFDKFMEIWNKKISEYNKLNSKYDNIAEKYNILLEVNDELQETINTMSEKMILKTDCQVKINEAVEKAKNSCSELPEDNVDHWIIKLIKRILGE